MPHLWGSGKEASRASAITPKSLRFRWKLSNFKFGELPVAQSNQDERIAKRSDESQERGSRLSQERAVTEDRKTSDAVRLAEKHAVLRDVNTKLPAPPYPRLSPLLVNHHKSI